MTKFYYNIEEIEKQFKENDNLYKLKGYKLKSTFVYDPNVMNPSSKNLTFSNKNNFLTRYFNLLYYIYESFKDKYDLTEIAGAVNTLPLPDFYYYKSLHKENTLVDTLFKKVKVMYRDYLERAREVRELRRIKELPGDVMDRISRFIGAPRNTQKKYSYDSDDDVKYKFKGLTYTKKTPRRTKGQTKMKTYKSKRTKSTYKKTRK
jgi:hypothetical protein